MLQNNNLDIIYILRLKMKLKLILYFVVLFFCSSFLNADWPMHRQNAQHTGFSAETGILDSVRLRWDWNLPTMIQCMRQSSPAIGDIDRDDTCEIVISASTAGYVYVLKDSIDTIPGDTIGDTLRIRIDTLKHCARVVWSYKANGWTNSSPLLYDINGDSKLDVIFGSWDKSVYALTHSGNFIWKFTTNGQINSSPVAGDIDKDGFPEIIIGSGRDYDPADDSSLYIIDWMGSLKGKYKTGGAIVSSPAIGDINGDTYDEIIFGSRDHKLYVLNYIGDTVWTFTAGHEIWSSPALGDLDGDSLPDIVFGCWDNYIYALKGNDGSLLWSYKAASYIDYQSAGLADIDKDNKLEVIIGSFEAGILYALEGENGDSIWALTWSGVLFPSSPAIADIDRDSSLEIITSMHDGRYYAWNCNGGNQWDWGYPGGDQDCPPAIGDIDCDSAIEAVGTDITLKKVFVLDFPINTLDTVIIGSAVEEESSRIDYNLSLSQNPCRSNTLISYSLPVAVERLYIGIYDLTGRLIKTLFNDPKTSGTYKQTLNTNTLPAGIYFIRMEINGVYKASKKLILMK